MDNFLSGHFRTHILLVIFYVIILTLRFAIDTPEKVLEEARSKRKQEVENEGPRKKKSPQLRKRRSKTRRSY